MPERILPVPEGLDGERADAGVAKLLGLSRSLVAAAILAGEVTQNGVVLAKSDRIKTGAMLSVRWEEPATAEVVETPVENIKIIHLDDDLVVVDKPVGVAAHPAVSWTGPTVLGALKSLGISVAQGGPPERNGIVQRLDVGTTGLMVVARSENAYSKLKAQFRAHTVRKTYHALVQGRPDPLVGTIDAPIGRHPSSDWKFGIVADGKHAVTHYETLESHAHASLLEIELETGRTHQIRVHLASQHHPLVGDPLYGADPKLAEALGLDRQWLHAMRLSFVHPGIGEIVTFESEYPEDLAVALEMIRAGRV